MGQQWWCERQQHLETGSYSALIINSWRTSQMEPHIRNPSLTLQEKTCQTEQECHTQRDRRGTGWRREKKRRRDWFIWTSEWLDSVSKNIHSSTSHHIREYSILSALELRTPLTSARICECSKKFSSQRIMPHSDEQSWVVFLPHLWTTNWLKWQFHRIASC